ncbi:MAG: dihydroorotase [bacterium]
MRLLLKHGLLVMGHESFYGDVFIENGVIEEINSSISRVSDKEISCEGKFILPGMIDTHVHFRDPGFTQKGDALTESVAAISGGVTTICDMPNTKPQTTTVDLVLEKQVLYANKCLCNFGIYIGATKTNLDELKKADELDTIPAIKVFMAESTGEMTLADDGYLSEIFSNTKKLIATHAESEARRLLRMGLFSEGKLPGAEHILFDDPYQHVLVRDNEVAALGSKHAVELSLKYKRKMHILHVSAKEELAYIEQGIQAGFVTAETCPHYLWFTREDVRSHGMYRIMNPSLKGEEDREALWDALRSGVISQIATDHAPHLPVEKDLPYGQAPAGLPGVEFALPLLLHAVSEGKLSLPQVVRLCCEHPAMNYGILHKGFLEEGYDADLVIIDPNVSLEITRESIRSKCGWSPYEGMTLKGGVVEKTIVNGELVFDNGTMVSAAKGKSIQVVI